MAKGRKLPTSRSERLLSDYGYSNGYGAGGADPSELREEDIWEVAAGTDIHDEENTSSSHFVWSTRASSRDGRLLGDSHVHHVGGLSLAFHGPAAVVTSPRIVHQYRGGGASPVAAPLRVGGTGHHMATSAPVNVPDWSKIYRVDSVGSMHDSDDGVDDRELGTQMVPPHEYLCARSQKTGATSVFEGVGRTLKGRDMSRVRDAVWSHTGFDG